MSVRDCPFVRRGVLCIAEKTRIMRMKQRDLIFIPDAIEDGS
jgi:hypothetical protein